MKRKMKPAKLAALAALNLACVIGLGYAAYSAMGQKTADEFGCFASVEAPQTIVLVDSSEPRWNEEQARALRQYFDGLYHALSFNEKLSVYSTEGDRVNTAVPRPSFHVCGQAETADDLTAIGAAGATDGYLQKQRERLFEKVFLPPLNALLALDQDEARRQFSQSPILEMLRGLSRLEGLKPGSRLVVISDLIQNSDSAQFCRVQYDMPPFADFEKRRVYTHRLKPHSLEGIQVEILMLQRYGYGRGDLRYCYSEEELVRFYRGYFKANGVSDVSVIRVRQGFAGDAR